MSLPPTHPKANREATTPAGPRKRSYQHGTVEREARKKGADVWYFRYRDQDGRQCRELFADVVECPTKASALKKAEELRSKANTRQASITFGALLDRYKAEELPPRKSTARGYLSMIRRLRYAFGKRQLVELAEDPIAIEQWLKHQRTEFRYTKPGEAEAETRELSVLSKRHLRMMLHVLFECAIRWRYLPMQRNPIDLVRVQMESGQRQKKIRRGVLTVEMYTQLLDLPHMNDRMRMLIQVAMCLGLRVSELLGLRWQDIDFDKGAIRIERSVVGKHEDQTKSASSEDELPLHDSLRALLLEWKEKAPPVNGWVFGNVDTGRPFHRDAMFTSYLVPARKAIGLDDLGWHTFRHSYRAMLKQSDVPIEVQQKLMRHANITTTMLYGQTSMLKQTTPHNARVVEMLPTLKRKA